MSGPHDTSPQHVAELFKALGHPARVLLLRLTWEQGRSGEELCGLLGLAAATVSHHLALLDGAGLMTAEQRGHHRFYRAHRAAFAPSLADLLVVPRPEPGPPAPPIPLSPTPLSPTPISEEERYRAKVLRTFFRDGLLTTIPAQRKKRDVVLTYLLRDFEPGRDYPESEVNALLGAYHPDYFTLRRELIMRGWLEREKGVYTRPEGVA
jgi:ArsR family transcriptional regulator, arsenate/arsenite/antimonite-responsive transcriptional repressor